MMHAVHCEHVRDRLEEFHDDELMLEERVAIQGHLQDCVACALAASELEDLRTSLRAMSLALPDRSDPEADRLVRRVTERVRVEELFSWTSEMRSRFQDLHLVWAALGATAAMMVCIIGSMSVLHATNQERPGSLAGLITVLANPGSNQNPVRLHDYMLVPRARTTAEFPPMVNDDSVLALAAVVTREGRIQNLEFLGSDRSGVIKVRPDVLLATLDAAARAEFEPAQAHGAPVAVSLVWLLASTTVRGVPEDVVVVSRPVGPPRPVPAVAPKSTAPAPAVRPTTDDFRLL
jgi:hypothetical protein